MLVPDTRMDEAIAVARETAAGVTVGDRERQRPRSVRWSTRRSSTRSKADPEGHRRGRDLVVGGVGRPDGLDTGYYVKPTVFANVSNDMTIAREEIFGPVLSILGYDNVEQAIDIGNDTEYGLAAYVSAGDIETARKVASKLRAGQVSINGGGGDLTAPFGGYKMSGNGREWGDYAFHEFLETKAVLGYAPKPNWSREHAGNHVVLQDY